MRVYRSLDDIAPLPVPRAVAIGTFDGVHAGHQQIINMAVTAAHSMQGVATVVTFEPHPGAVLRPGDPPPILTPFETKVELMESLGVGEIAAIPFDLAFAQLPPQAFARRLLSDRLGARQVSVGENFRFGRGGEGSAADLLAFGQEMGFSVSALQLLRDGGETVSSTRIRRLIAQGVVEEASRLLTRPYSLSGTVVSGVGRGRTLGMPTANLRVRADAALPGLGVYVTRTRLSSRPELSSVTSVGTNPTFESDGVVRIETFLLDFHGSVYEEPMVLEFLSRLRDQRAFPDKESLMAQMQEDVAQARGFFGSGGR